MGLRSQLATLSNSTMQWQVPRKTILSKEQVEYFQGSKTYQDIISYIETLNNAVIGSKLTDDCDISPVSDTIIKLYRLFLPFNDEN